jgi:hypothetical protein
MLRAPVVGPVASFASAARQRAAAAAAAGRGAAAHGQARRALGSDAAGGPSDADAEPLPELVSWVLSRGGSVDGATLANLAGRDGGSGWGLKATRVSRGR